MFKEERKNTILDILKEKEYASAELLSKLLYVSLPTVRRDLAELSGEGLIKRCHGGAASLSAEKTGMPIGYRINFGQKEKMIVAEKASKLVKKGDVIFIDPSSTVLDMLPFIKEISELTVVTNSLRALNALCDKPNIRLYSTGGSFVKSSMAFVGKQAMDFISGFNFDLFFFSSAAVNEKGMITDYSEPETLLRKSSLKYAKKTVFLCTSDKFGKNCAYNVCPLSSLDEIICDTQIPT